ncbi:hypothetical protein V6Z11_A03G112500 [Gossypium hirsutum]
MLKLNLIHNCNCSEYDIITNHSVPCCKLLNLHLIEQFLCNQICYKFGSNKLVPRPRVPFFGILSNSVRAFINGLYSPYISASTHCVQGSTSLECHSSLVNSTRDKNQQLLIGGIVY